MDGVLDAIHLDDVRAGSGKWRNIQDSVRYAVAALCTTASAQARAITTLEAKLEALCSHFASHAGRSEEIFSQHHSRIAGLEKAVGSVKESRSSSSASVDVRLASVEEQCGRVATMVRTLETQVPSITDLRAFATKAEVAEKASIADVNEALSYKANKDAVEKALRGKADKEDLIDRGQVVSREDWNRVTSEVQRVSETVKAGLAEMTAAINRKASKADISDAKSGLQELVRRGTSDALSAVALKVSRAEFTEALAAKADAHTADVRVLAGQEEMLRLFKQKADASDLAALKQKADVGAVQELKRALAEVTQTLKRKAEAAEVAAILTAHADLRYQIDKKADVAELRAFQAAQAEAVEVLKQQAVHASGKEEAAVKTPPRVRRTVVNSSVRTSVSPPPPGLASTSTIQARWIWKSKELLEGRVVPWEVEAVNEAPELLQWRAGRGTVTAIKPGLYQLCVGFFSPTLPKITVFVDDHAAVSTTPSLTGSDNPITVHRHPAGCVGGSCMVQFLALPARASVSVTFEGDSAGQGFLWITKL